MRAHNQLLTALAACASILVSAPASAGINEEMEGIFGSMVNSTDPQTFDTASRGGITGGSMSVKNQIIDQNVVSFTPPGLSAGCGGIDMQMGSFSAISEDQIVNTLRAVASNAQGYAFQLALDNVFPEGAKWMKRFQKDVQNLNRHLGNTCAMAKYGVDKVSNMMGTEQKEEAPERAQNNTLNDEYTGFFPSLGPNPDKSPASQEANSDPSGQTERNIYANIMWEAFKEANVKNQFAFGDDEILEIMMSLTGTVIRKRDSGDPSGRAEMPIRDGNLISVFELIEGTPDGSDTSVYRCDNTDRCMGVSVGDTQIESIHDRIIEAFNDPTSGAIQKWAFNSGNMTNEQKDMISSLPLSGLVKRMSSNPKIARAYVKEVALPVSYTTIDTLINDAFRTAGNALETASTALEGQNTVLIDMMRDELEASEEKYRRRMAIYAQTHDIKPITHHLKRGTEVANVIQENARDNAMQMFNE